MIEANPKKIEIKIADEMAETGYLAISWPVTLKYPARSHPTWTNPQVDPPSKYHATSSKKLDHCILKMFDLKPEYR